MSWMNKPINLVTSFVSCANCCIPSRSIYIYTSNTRKLVDWKDGVQSLKQAANFWYKVWKEAGYPTSGVLFQIKKHTKSRFKYEVRRRKRRHRPLVRSKLASTFSIKRSNNFWSVVHSLNKSRSKNYRVPIVDSVSGESDIANLFASKLSSRLNTHPGLSADDLHSFDTSLLLEYQLSEVKVSTDDVLSAIESLKPGKTDSDRVSSYHLKYAVPVIVESIASFFTAILHHGYMPKYFRDCVVIPISKSCHDLSSSESSVGLLSVSRV